MQNRGGRHGGAKGGNVARARPFQILVEGDRLFLDPSPVEKFLG
jgi:hypothetical protein